MKPTLYIFVGFPGSGKTTVAQIIADATGATHLWADQERQKRFDNVTHDRQESAVLYDALNREAGELLKQGKSVIFDTNFNFWKDRQKMRDIASSRGADTKLIWITTPSDLARRRAVHESDGQPTRLFGDMSDEAFDRMAGNLQPPSPDENPIHVDGTRVDSSQLLEQLGIK